MQTTFEVPNTDDVFALTFIDIESALDIYEKKRNDYIVVVFIEWWVPLN
jgi:hypothetical protein